MTALDQPPFKVLVLGLGNPDRGDDGVGDIVTRRLYGRLPADVAIWTRSGDMLSLIDDWAGFDAVVCIDAAAPVDTPGRVYRVDLTVSALPRDFALVSSHAFGLSDAVELARNLRVALPHIVIYALEGRCFDSGVTVTTEVAAAAAEVAEQVVAEVGKLRRGDFQGRSDA